MPRRHAGRNRPRFCATARLLILGVAFSTTAQGAPQAAADDLSQEIQALREGLKAIQRDLQEIKAMLARQAPAGAAALGAVIDLGSNPAKGERTAKLTLVEFSDYQ